jgi:hypothetical protein
MLVAVVILVSLLCFYGAVHLGITAADFLMHDKHW